MTHGKLWFQFQNAETDMMLCHVRALLTALTLTLTFGFVATPGAAQPTAPIPAGATPDETERLYLQELDRQAAEVFAEFQKSVPPEQRTGAARVWQRSLTEAKLLLRRTKAFKESFMRLGRSMIYVPLVGEVLSTLVVPPVAIALGLPSVALVSGVTPLGVVGLVANGAYLMQRERVRIWWSLRDEMRESGARLRDLANFRDDLLGFASKNRIQSAVFAAAEDEAGRALPVEVVQKIRADRVRQAGLIDIKELESVVRSHGSTGERFLEHTYLNRARPELYAAQLVEYVQTNPELAGRAAAVAREGVPITEPLKPARDLLLEIDDIRKDLGLVQDQVMAERKQLKEFLKRGETATDALRVKQLRGHIDQLLDDLGKRRFALNQLEYAFALRTRNAPDGVATSVPAFRAQLDRFKTEGQVIEAGRVVTKRLAQQLNARLAPLKPKTTCGKWMSILSFGHF